MDGPEFSHQVDRGDTAPMTHHRNRHWLAERPAGSEEGSYLRLIDLCITQL